MHSTCAFFPPLPAALAKLSALLAGLEAGGKWSEATRKSAIRRDRYPGFAALLARL